VVRIEEHGKKRVIWLVVGVGFEVVVQLRMRWCQWRLLDKEQEGCVDGVVVSWV
jgi:hypothetical protein